MHRIELSSKFITAERKNRDVNSCKLPCRLGDNNYHGGKIPVDTVDRSRISAVKEIDTDDCKTKHWGCKCKWLWRTNPLLTFFWTLAANLRLRGWFDRKEGSDRK